MRFLNDLSIGEVIAVTDQWTGQLQPVVLSIPELVPLLPRVQEDHDALVQGRAGSSAEVLLRGLSEQAESLDTRHDHLQRALSFSLRGAIEAALGQDPPDLNFAITVEDAHERLFPNGLDIIKASYEAEAGNAVQMVHLAKTELTEVLAAIPAAKDKTALGLVEHIGKVGASLGATEQKKSVAAAKAEKEEITPAEIRRRMRAWADTVETALRALERTKADATVVEQIQKPVADAAEKARQRRAAKGLAEVNKKEKGGKEPEAQGSEGKEG